MGGGDVVGATLPVYSWEGGRSPKDPSEKFFFLCEKYWRIVIRILARVDTGYLFSSVAMEEGDNVCLQYFTLLDLEEVTLFV